MRCGEVKPREGRRRRSGIGGKEERRKRGHSARHMHVDTHVANSINQTLDQTIPVSLAKCVNEGRGQKPRGCSAEGSMCTVMSITR